MSAARSRFAWCEPSQILVARTNQRAKLEGSSVWWPKSLERLMFAVFALPRLALSSLGCGSILRRLLLGWGRRGFSRSIGACLAFCRLVFFKTAALVFLPRPTVARIVTARSICLGFCHGSQSPFLSGYFCRQDRPPLVYLRACPKSQKARLFLTLDSLQSPGMNP